MSEPGGQQQNEDDEAGDRRLANIVLAVGFVVLVGIGVWLADAMVTAKKADDCLASGRRNCFPVDVPARPQ